MSKFLHANDNDDAKAGAIPQVFFENSRAKNAFYQHFLLLQLPYLQNASSNGSS